jgi:sodium pump decarboxylase gamma subunit
MEPEQVLTESTEQASSPPSNLDQGLALTGLGMAWVFIFLTLMILFMTLSSKIIQQFFPEKEQPAGPVKAAGPKDAHIAAAIAIAHHHHNQEQS